MSKEKVNMIKMRADHFEWKLTQKWLDGQHHVDDRLYKFFKEKAGEAFMKALKNAAEAKVRARLTKQILADSGFEDKVERQMIDVIGKMPDPRQIKDQIKDKLGENSAQRWSDPLDKLARELVEGVS